MIDGFSRAVHGTDPVTGSGWDTGLPNQYYVSVALPTVARFGFRHYAALPLGVET